MELSETFTQWWDEEHLFKCIWFEENLKEERIGKDKFWDEHENPCLGFNGEGEFNCAFCKPGLARILVEFTLQEDGLIKQWVFCGSVRTPERSATGAYTYLDPATVTNDQISNQDFECFPSKWYYYAAGPD